MSCFEGLEMGLNLEVLRPEVDALGRWSRQLQVPEAGTLLCACGAARGTGLLSPAKINEQGLPKAMFLKEVTLNQEAVHNEPLLELLGVYGATPFGKLRVYNAIGHR